MVEFRKFKLIVMVWDWLFKFDLGLVLYLLDRLFNKGLEFIIVFFMVFFFEMNNQLMKIVYKCEWSKINWDVFLGFVIMKYWCLIYWLKYYKIFWINFVFVINL